MTSIGYVIQHGEDIPDDVIELLDRTGDTWRLQPDGLWDCFVNDSDEPVGGSYEDINADLLRAKYTLLAVTAVREQPAAIPIASEDFRHPFVEGGASLDRCKQVFQRPEGGLFCNYPRSAYIHEVPTASVSGLCEVGDDGVTCIVAAPDHRRIYHHGSAFDIDGFLRLKGTATGDNQLDPATCGVRTDVPNALHTDRPPAAVQAHNAVERARLAETD